MPVVGLRLLCNESTGKVKNLEYFKGYLYVRTFTCRAIDKSNHRSILYVLSSNLSLDIRVILPTIFLNNV